MKIFLQNCKKHLTFTMANSILYIDIIYIVKVLGWAFLPKSKIIGKILTKIPAKIKLLSKTGSKSGLFHFKYKQLYL